MVRGSPDTGGYGLRAEGAGRWRPQAFVDTWTILVDGCPHSWVSRLCWWDQPRPERGTASEDMPEPFRGHTITDQHPTEPQQSYTRDALQLPYPIWGVPERHQHTHRQVFLQQRSEAVHAAVNITARRAPRENPGVDQ